MAATVWGEQFCAYHLVLSGISDLSDSVDTKQDAPMCATGKRLTVLSAVIG